MLYVGLFFFTIMYFIDLKPGNYEECEDGDGTGSDEKEITSSDYPSGFTKQECIGKLNFFSSKFYH